jgi:tripartite-type tricarboxylate transporter receptor subunit TctC
VQSGAIRALASTGRERTTVAPDLPTVAEAGLPGFDTNIWFGIMAPTGTPAEIIDRLAAAAKSAVASEPVKTAFAAQMVDPLTGGPNEFREWVAAETRKWDAVITRAGLARK